jgi:hypothetical protein
MSFGAPLTAVQLHAVAVRYKPSADRGPCSFPDSSVWPDVKALLFEIKRMRSMLLRADQLKAGFKAPSMVLESVRDEFLENLAKEPCVIEWQEDKIELLGPNGRKVKPNGSPPE